MIIANNLPAFKRQLDSAFVVSAWHVDYYSDPEVYVGFFPESMRDEMQEYVKRYEGIPEMAFMQEIESHDKMVRASIERLKMELAHTEKYIDAEFSGPEERAYLSKLKRDIKDAEYSLSVAKT